MSTENKILAYSRGIEYHESLRLTRLSGFLMIYGNQRQVTLSAQLTDEEKRRGLTYLLDQLGTPEEQTGIYLWMNEVTPSCN